MPERSKRPQLDDPGRKKNWLTFSSRGTSKRDGDGFGRLAEAIARFMGTPMFLVGMTVFCGVWLAWNTFMPEVVQFDPRALNFTLLTLILSLQASYAAPLLLLSDNRQADRDRVQAEQDRQSNERAHAITDFLTREIASLRLAINDVATRDYVRGEIRDLLEELQSDDAESDARAHGEATEGDASGEEQHAAHERQHARLRDLLRDDIREILREELAAARSGAVYPPVDARQASAPTSHEEAGTTPASEGAGGDAERESSAS